jgi:hypothetical protein
MAKYCKLNEKKNRCIKTNIQSENDYENCTIPFMSKTKECVKRLTKSVELSFDKQWKKRENDFKKHDNVEFKYKGYQCEIRKTKTHWCGYVYLSGHTKSDDYDKFGHYYVHGGITYIQPVNGKIKIGFDCAHLGDFSESMATQTFKKYHDRKTKFRTFNYVKSQIHNLVNEIIKEGKYKP